MRVAEAVAGPNWGSTFTPRIGSEVLVDFIDNDIDRPVIVACLFNGNDLPPFAAGVDSGRNHAGVISGIHSHNLDAGGYNQWVVDDSTHQLRMRLASSTATSQLNLGHLIHQSPHSAQRGHYRGHGFELRTDAWGSLRGGEGVFISTQARNHQGSGVQSTPLDSAESVAQLNAAQTLTDTLTQAATHHTALVSAQAAQAQQQRLQAIAPQQQGHYPGDINGQPALKAHNAGRDLDNGQPVERFQHPFIHLDSAASMAWATPNSTTVFAGGQLNWTTQADSHWAAANTAASVSAHATTLFTHQGGIQAIAADGPVSLQAHTGPLDILADQALTVTSVNGRIEIKAKDTITLQAGQTAITLDGGNITFTCPGQFTVHASRHPFEGGSRQADGLNALPTGVAPPLICIPCLLKAAQQGTPILTGVI
ncbi:MAG: hypothetical protein CTY24_12405 [Methylobacter sp.]|nr:MAG: hypothetical protein CTY24_12405 [Methylobacter sp.]